MLPHVVPLLQELIRIPSVNPDSATGTGVENTGEGRLANHVGGLLDKLGAEVRYDEVEPGRPNVVGRFPTKQPPEARVLLGPHLDTVGVGGMTIDPFGGEVEDGKVWGRGACDTKGTMAAMLAALGELGGRLRDSRTEITFVAFMGEETGQPGSMAFAREHPGAYDFALIGEPTDCRVVHAHKGCAWIDLVVNGRAAHASTPEQGENALVRLAGLTGRLDHAFRRVLWEEFSDPVLGGATINPGAMHAGTRANIVPDRATLTLDIRTTPALDQADPVKVLAEFLDAEEREKPPVHIHELFRAPPMHTPADDPMVVRLLEATGSELDIAPWFCDAAHLSVAGIPAVAAGPGGIAQAHTQDEWISVDGLEEGVVFYRRFLEALA